MPGLRIHHPTLRNCVLLVPHPGEIKRVFRTDNKGRKPKDYRITLDNDGNCIVSLVIWRRLQEARGDFIILNEVEDPPAQVIGFHDSSVENPAVYKEIQGAIREVAPPGVTVYIKENYG